MCIGQNMPCVVEQSSCSGGGAAVEAYDYNLTVPDVRPVHLLRIFLLRVLESNFPGDPLSNSTDIGIPTPWN